MAVRPLQPAYFVSHFPRRTLCSSPKVCCRSQRLSACVSGQRWNSTALKVNQARLMNDIHYTCQWGTGERWGDGPTETGMKRLTLSDADKQVRDWFAETTNSLGCEVTIDEMGNMFAVRPGKKQGFPTFAGSHLDTQPTGGRYDGILGVTAAVEMLRVLKDNNHETEYPVGVVNWTNEEGARFPKSMVSSGVWAGSIPLEQAYNLTSTVRGDDSSMLSELERIGYRGSVPCSYQAIPMAAHFELHIEQGPILEKESRKIGVVQGVSAYRWYTVTVKGRESHTGTTDLSSRADALLATSKMIVASRQLGYENGARVSTGIIEARPGSTNTIPGHVTFSIDVRAPSNELVDKTEQALKDAFEAIAAGPGQTSLFNVDPEANKDVCSVEWRLDFESLAINFHPDCIQCVTDASRDIFGADTEKLTKPMVSGAGHDSVYTSKRFPTSMVFVPSREGISHNPREYTAPEDCAIGAQVLMGAVLHYDQRRNK